jgi:hypothetical protein
MLPVDNPTSYTLLVRSCTYGAQSAVAWDVDFLTPGAEVAEDIRKDILGARRRVLFVEGGATSLDKPLYTLVFPDTSVVPRASCRDVELAVVGIRSGEGMHWLRAFGIVDSDGRSADDVGRLQSNGIYALSVHSVESIYYLPPVQRRVATRHAAVVGEDPTAMLGRANSAVLEAASHNANRLAERVAERAVREAVFQKLPRKEDVASRTPVNIVIDVAQLVEAEGARLQAAVASKDVGAIISRYPMRETAALQGVARALGFQSRTQYEAAVLKMLLDDPDGLAEVRAIFGPLTAALDGAK